MINNAGIMFTEKFTEIPLEKCEEMVTTNVLGVMNGVKLVIEGMLKRKCGTIINISSTSAKFAYFEQSVYNATKSAISLFTESIRKEVADSNIRVR